MANITLQVRKDRLTEARLVREEDGPLAPGQVRVRIDRFALTANNVTYAAFGEAMHYWDFYPVQEPGWGIVPAWGFASVVQSLHPGVATGERLWGYWPMARHATLQPGKLTESGFVEAAPHRAELHAVYNQVRRCSSDPFYTPDSEDAQAVLRPLYTTSWLIDDFLADNDFFGARRVLMSSASSKTAWGTALALRQRSGIEVVGFTSAANRAFCERIGAYHRVLAYEDLGALEADVPCVFVDFAGNARFRQALHGRFANLRYSCAVGGTHVGQLGGGGQLAGPRPTMFFAPAQLHKRSADWGPAEVNRRLVDAWHAFRQQVSAPGSGWLQVRKHTGAPAVQQAYETLARGDVDPAVGHILTLA